MPQLQTHERTEGKRVTITYTRADLGIDTAEIERTPDGHWITRCYYGPEPDEHDTETVVLESTANFIATQHSLHSLGF
jgi:hypothetical protein